MKIKVDENIGRNGINLLREAGHDVLTSPKRAAQRWLIRRHSGAERSEEPGIHEHERRS